MNVGRQIGEPESRAVRDRALGPGINVVDTADRYGREAGDGLNERFIGSWFDRSGARDKFVLATKAYAPMSDRPDDASREAWLRTDWIDICPLHHMRRETPWEEIWQALETLTGQAKIRYAGWHLARARAAARPAPLSRAGQRAAQGQPAHPARGAGGAAAARARHRAARGDPGGARRQRRSGP